MESWDIVNEEIKRQMKERYDNIDGLRVISCLCIIAMHIRANAFYNLPHIVNSIVASWTQFVPLFLMVSGFGMFCGYYEEFRNGSNNLNTFYNKRYKKILPFFITLIVLDILIERSVSHLIEGITEATLVFGLLPNNEPSVIGVSWTLGVIFLFYILFPFVVYLFWSKKRSWIAFGMSIVISIFCSSYYFTDKFVINSFAPRHNILYCAPLILAGGIVYLNKEIIRSFVQRHRIMSLVGCLAISIVWYITPSTIGRVDLMMIKNLLLFMPWLMYAISVKSWLLNNRVTKYLSGMSLELYLGQMLVFRLLEKGHLLFIINDGWLGFLFTWIMTVIGLILLVEIWRRSYKIVQKKLRFCRWD